jgi:hypothetical protein
MSRQFRYRMAALVLGGLLLGGPLLVSGEASADQGAPAERDGGQRVTFAGADVFGLSCRSHPDIESISVPADSRIRVVNRTGHSANLELGGDIKGMLPDNGSTEVVFRRGTTAVTLTPACALGSDASPILVTAEPSTPAGTPNPIPHPSAGDSSAFTDSSDDSSDPSDSARPDVLAAPANSPRATSPGAGRPPTKSTGSRHSSTVAHAAKGAVHVMPPGGDDLRSKNKVKATRSTPAAAAPAVSSGPSGAGNGLVAGVPPLALDPSAAVPAAVAAPTTEIAAAEPVAAMEPIRERGPIGLLAAIAAVCALGVGIAAIRAFVSQRAIRANMS